MRSFGIGLTLLLVNYTFICSGSSPGSGYTVSLPSDTIAPADTTASDSTANDSLSVSAFYEAADFNSIIEPVTVDPADILYPGNSVQQLLKGNAAGLYVQEASGEPGTDMNIFIRGISRPLLEARDLAASRPLVVIDGIPLIGEHPFAYDIQQYDFNRIGPATNLLTNIDPSNIKSIRILKDLASAGHYGPRGVNGVVEIETRSPESRRRITFDSYVGVVQKDNVHTINGVFENDFRQQFYERYAGITERQRYPLYLQDSLNSAYYGPSNWNDLYYRNSMVHSINASITGGSARANFRFALGTQKTNGIADNTGLTRSGAMFAMNMLPFEWLSVSTMVNANRLDRDRNRSLRDRFAEMKYLPDLSLPLAPNKANYQEYLDEFSKSFDDNKNNIIDGYFRVGLNFGKFNFYSRFSVDYNEGIRDIFYPGTLLETNSYVSNYYGYNQRMMVDNVASYSFDWNGRHHLDLEAGQSYQADLHRYNYAYAYKGPNDFIKINLLHADPNLGNYLEPTGFSRFMVFKFLDRTESRLISYYARGVYDFEDKYSFSLLLRNDGSSNAQPDSRWFVSPVVSAAWNIKNDLLKTNDRLDELKLYASAGRMGRLQLNDRYAQGPQYTVDIGWTGNPIASSFNAFPTLNRPYSLGYVGYDIPWAYTDMVNVGVNAAILDNRLRLSLEGYYKTDNELLIGIPAYAEYGYNLAYESGMKVLNTGVDLSVSANILQKQSGLNWNTSLNLNYNKNELLALPGGLDELVVGNRLLKVGESIDQYWLYQNEGIYNSDEEVPVNPETNLPLHYNGISLMAGDPRWKDLNGDYMIDNQDKELTGHSMPLVSGGFINDLQYKNWTLHLHLYFMLGRDALNQAMANRFDFINREGSIEMNSVKEITFWEKQGDYEQYPVYNPWSPVIPYRTDQDLFLEDASFLKLRTVSLGYDLSNADWFTEKVPGISRMFLYFSANNLFTLTPYSGRDPELIDYTGYDTGYGLSIPRTYTIGVKMDL